MIRSVWIEIRPALSSCNICVVFKKKLHYPVKVKMKKSEMILDIGEKSFPVRFKDFIADPLTMTGFQVVNQYLNFRIQVHCEVKLSTIPPKKFGPPLQEVDKYSLMCQCLNSLTGEITFKRILPLPSNDLSLSDLFCHVHNNHSLSDSNVPEPKVSDCFFTDHFITVNSSLITGCFNRGKFIKCKRCLANVGVKRKNHSDLWLSCLKLPHDQISPLMQLKYFLRNAVSDPFAIFPHVLFEAEEINSYLSIIVVDKNLILSNSGQDLVLENNQVIKLKYNFYSSHENQVKSLKNDPFNAVHHIYVEKSFLNFTLEYLISCSRNIPTVFNKIDGTCMAYLNLGE